VRIFFSPGDHFRYLLVPPHPLRPGVLYVPYWRLRGTIFTCEEAEIRARYIDGTTRAIGRSPLPSSLGVRPRALPLRFATDAVEGAMVRAETTADAAVAELEGTFAAAVGIGPGTPDFPFAKAFIGDSSSIVYAPVYERETVIEDAVTGEIVAGGGFGPVARGAETSTAGGGAVRFIPALCPDCGWNLEGEGDSEVVLCGNCDSAWAGGAAALTRVPLAVLGREEEAEAFLPFWRVAARVRGVALSSYGDLIRFANVPRVVAGEAARERLLFWVPAFKVRGELLLRLSRLMTLAQPKAAEKRELPRAYLYPVTLPAGEAREILTILIAALAMAKKKVFPLLGDVTVEPEETVLTFLPFTRRGDELISTLFPFSVSANALKYGRNL
jgi:hypothetical protein